ncbi:MAG: hypothetical protein J7K66_04810 [Anaerolineaceae bacterium]|nr:hypothetical protein [Anaerolineaceae bacterium]
MRKFISILLTIFLVFPLLLSAQAAISITSWALDRQFYIDALAQPQVTSNLISSPMINKLLHDRLGLPPEVDTSELESILKSTLTTNYMDDQVSGLINAFFDYLQGKADSFAPALDLGPVKSALEGSQQDAFLNALAAAIPPCAPGQTPSFGAEGQTACKPADISDDILVEQILKPAMANILSAFPDEIPLGGKFQNWKEDARWRTLLPGMAAPASILLGILALVFIAVCIWYIAALIADSSWRVRLQWLGWTLFIPAALIFLLGFASQSGIPTYWIQIGLGHANLSSTPFDLELNETLKILTASALQRAGSAFQMVGGISGALATALIFWSIATPRKRHEELE